MRKQRSAEPLPCSVLLNARRVCRFSREQPSVGELVLFPLFICVFAPHAGVLSEEKHSHSPLSRFHSLISLHFGFCQFQMSMAQQRDLVMSTASQADLERLVVRQVKGDYAVLTLNRPKVFAKIMKFLLIGKGQRARLRHVERIKDALQGARRRSTCARRYSHGGSWSFFWRTGRTVLNGTDKRGNASVV